ncbi:MAG: methyl-accepting chemotaxis protein [Lachnospiraceae bacterium]|jgi:methyl-accepting chemotaxis protein|nr:methyl-accepting chemotaxis protein [Lachnospiraceae bacterium]
MKKKISMRGAFSCFIIPMIIILLLVVTFFGLRIKKQADEDKKLYYDTLYTINTSLINMDRDFYQSMLAAVQLKSERLYLEKETVDTMLATYNENAQETEEGLAKVVAIAKQYPELFKNVKTEDGKSFEELATAFGTGLSTWKGSYDFSIYMGDWNLFTNTFYDIRGYLDSMQKMTESWANQQIANNQKQVTGFVVSYLVLLTVLAAVLLVVSMLIANKMVRSLQSITKGIEGISGGDFATPVFVKTGIKEFTQIANYTEEMRDRVSGVLKDVVNGAESVSAGAENAKDSVSGSQKTASDIASAVNDLASGATSMAEDVQDTTGITVEIGNAVDQVMTAATDNLERGRSVYDESGKVQKQLQEIRRQDAETDAMAGEVAESVNQTAEVVNKISTAAESIISIASQTNLLALNASIEAARAGEAGRGFAVVADNIKGLAEETNKMAGEITDMLSAIADFSDRNKKLTGKIKEATTNEVAALETMEESFDQMMVLLQESEEGNKSIMGLVEELNTHKDAIVNSMENLSSISEENAASTEETGASLSMLEATMQNIVEEANHLNEVAEQLQQNVSFFRV